MAGPDLVVKVAANIDRLRSEMTAASASVKTLETASTQATAASRRWSDELRKFDGVLASVGLNIGSEIRAIDDIASSSGKSAKEIGGLATAGLAMGAAVAGWKMGRMVAEFFDLDRKIGNATASLLGFGDVSAQTAGAKQDSINLAIKRGAEGAITYAEAIQFNTDWLKKRNAASAEAVAALATEAVAQKKVAAALVETNAAAEKWAGLMAELTAAGKGWRAQVDEIDGSVVEAIKFYLAAGVSQSTLATTYGLTAEQIKACASALAADTEAARQATQAAAEHASSVSGVTRAVSGETDALEANTAAAAKNAAAKKLAEAVAAAAAAAAAKAANMAKGGSFELENIEITAENKARYIARLKHLKALVANFPGRAAGGSGATGLNPMDAVGWSEMLREQAELAALKKALPGYAGGVQNAPGGFATIGERGPETMYVPPGANIYPNGSGSGAGSDAGPRIIQLVVDGRVLASVLDDATMQRQRAIGTRF